MIRSGIDNIGELAVGVPATEFDVAVDYMVDRFEIVGSRRTGDLGGHAHYNRTIRNFTAWSYDSAGRDDAPTADHGAVQHDGADPNERPFPHASAVNDRAVSNAHVVGDVQRRSVSCVKNRCVLDVDPVADTNRRNVAADDGMMHDRRVAADRDVPGHIRCRRDIDLSAKSGFGLVLHRRPVYGRAARRANPGAAPIRTKTMIHRRGILRDAGSLASVRGRHPKRY